jgi:peptide/nickel transport system substrate-binding protein
MKTSRVLLALLVVVVIAVACVPAPSPVPPTAAPKPTDAPKPTAIPPTAVPAAPTAPAATKPPATTAPTAAPPTVVNVFPNAQLTINFLATSAQTGNTEAVFNALHCNLLNLDDKFKFQPELAEKHELSPDGKTYTFTLRKNAKWHDGQPVTAEDVEFSWMVYATSGISLDSRIREPVITSVLGGAATRESAKKSKGYGDTLKYEGIQIADPYTIKFTLAAQDPLWLTLITQYPNGWLLPKHILKDVPWADWAKHPMALTNPVGCGPYKFSRRVDGQFDEFVAFADYFGGKPKLDRIVFKSWLVTNVATAQIESGELDVMLGVPQADAERLEKNPRVKLLTAPAAAAYQLSINTFRVTDKRVRQAMAYALNRKVILQSVFKGQGELKECCLLNDWVIPPDQKFREYDPAKAKQLIAEAKWDSNRELTILFPSGYRQTDVLLPIVQQQLAEVGIKTKQDPQDPATYQKKLLTDKDWDIFFTQGANMLPDPGSFTAWECRAGQSPASGWFYCDDKWADLWKAGRTTTNLAERTKIYMEIQRIFHEEQPTVNIVVPAIIFALNSRLEGFTPTSNPPSSFWNVHTWSLK